MPLLVKGGGAKLEGEEEGGRQAVEGEGDLERLIHDTSVTLLTRIKGGGGGGSSKRERGDLERLIHNTSVTLLTQIKGVGVEQEGDLEESSQVVEGEGDLERLLYDTWVTP